MSRISGGNTKPEIVVRKMLHSMGYRFRLHSRRLPGTPDVVLPRHHKIVFIHGCFWHGHKNCSRAKRPVSNEDFWNKKIEANIKRDNIAVKELRNSGWEVLIIWQCETKDHDVMLNKLLNFMTNISQM